MSADRDTEESGEADREDARPATADSDPSTSSVDELALRDRAFERQAAPGPLRPLPPLAKRLNRNALTVAAALAGVTVLTVVVVTSPSRSASSGGSRPTASADAAPPVPARPTFLDQPVRTLPGPRTGITDAQSTSASSAQRAGGRGGAATSHPAPTGRGVMSGATEGVSGVLPVPPPLSGGEPEPPSIDPAMMTGNGVVAGGVSARAQAYQAALTSSVLVGRSVRRGLSSASTIGDATTDAGGPTPVLFRSSELGQPGQAELLHAAPVLPERPQPTSPSVAGSPASAVGGSAGVAGGDTPSRLDPAGSPYTLRAGTIIAGLLVTGVNSDLPGEVLAQTSRDVYDSRTQQAVLVPKGSRLIGSYDNRSVGTGRLIVTWSRLIFPDGRSALLPHLAGTDGQGQAGLHDQIDHHYGRVYGAALLTLAFSAGVQLSQPQQSGLYAAPNSRQVAAGALGQTMGDVSLESARRGLDILPTISIRPGQPFNVFLAGDLVFDGPYAPDSVVLAP